MSCLGSYHLQCLVVICVLVLDVLDVYRSTVSLFFWWKAVKPGFVLSPPG